MAHDRRARNPLSDSVWNSENKGPWPEATYLTPLLETVNFNPSSNKCLQPKQSFIKCCEFSAEIKLLNWVPKENVDS